MKKITKRQFDAMIKASARKPVAAVYSVDGEDVTVNIKTFIDVTERTALISNIVDCLFADTEYLFYLKNSIYWYFMVSTFTDLPIPPVLKTTKEGTTIFNREALSTVYQLALETSLGHDIAEAVGESNLSLINHEIEEGIEFRKAQVLQRGSALEKVVGAIEGIMGAIGEATANLKDLDPNALNGMLEGFGQNDPNALQNITSLFEHK